jgi:hypothetical protein
MFIKQLRWETLVAGRKVAIKRTTVFLSDRNETEFRMIKKNEVIDVPQHLTNLIDVWGLKAIT